MRFSLFAAVAVASIAATGNAARLQSNAFVQQSPASESWMDQVRSLELSQAEASTMSEAEIMARAETIADIYLESQAATDVDAEAKAAFIQAIGKGLKNVGGMFMTYVLPVLAAILIMKTLAPGFSLGSLLSPLGGCGGCGMMGGGMGMRPPCAGGPPPMPCGHMQVETGPPGSGADPATETKLAQLLSELDLDLN